MVEPTHDDPEVLGADVPEQAGPGPPEDEYPPA